MKRERKLPSHTLQRLSAWPARRRGSSLLALAGSLLAACSGGRLARGPLLAPPPSLRGHITPEETGLLQRAIESSLSTYPPALRVAWEDKLAAGAAACHSEECLRGQAGRAGALWLLHCSVERGSLLYVPDPQATLPTHGPEGNRHPAVSAETLGTWQLQARLIHARTTRYSVEQRSECSSCSAAQAAARLQELISSVTARVPAE